MKKAGKSMQKPVVVVPNWNGLDGLKVCLNSLIAQSESAHLIVVDNGSVDGSVEFIEKNYPAVELIKHSVNKGYTGGVNPGFKRAIELKSKYVAPFNNDALADRDWLKNMVSYLDAHDEAGIATCKVLSMDGSHIDSTGDQYTVWGLAFPRGRGETNLEKYDSQTEIFAASGAASLYRVSMLEEIGLLDQDFFAYYEDVDLSFRAQLAGWKIALVPSSKIYHATSTTSNRIKGFTTYQTLKNLPMLLFKNVPSKYLWRVTWRFLIADTLFFCRAVSRGQGLIAIKGQAVGKYRVLTIFSKRRRIQKSKKVSDEYIWSMMTHDLPPNASALRNLRASWWKITGKVA